MRRKEIRVKTLALLAAVAGIISFVVFELITRNGTLVPRPALLSGVLLVVIGGLVLWLARPVRRYLQGRATTTLDPLRAARTVVLAQAAALTGAAAAGWYLGQLVVVLTGLSLEANRGRVLPLAAIVVAALRSLRAGWWPSAGAASTRPTRTTTRRATAPRSTGRAAEHRRRRVARGSGRGATGLRRGQPPRPPSSPGSDHPGPGWSGRR